VIIAFIGIPACKRWVSRVNATFVWEHLWLLSSHTDSMHLPVTNNTVCILQHKSLRRRRCVHSHKLRSTLWPCENYPTATVVVASLSHPAAVNKTTRNYVLAKTMAGNLALRVNESCGTHIRWRHGSHDVTAGAAEVARVLRSTVHGAAKWRGRRASCVMTGNERLRCANTTALWR